MLRKALLTLVTALLWTTPLAAQPATPMVYLNEKVRLAELAVGQRATLRYDLRPVAGQHLKVELYRHDQVQGEKPLKEWIFHRPVGQERLSFADLPRAVYRMVAYASDEAGNRLAFDAPMVHVAYGGWRAWEAFKPPVEAVTAIPAGFENVDVATNVRNRDIQIALDPPAVVLRPGGEVRLRAGFSGTDPLQLKWKIVGEGQLKAEDEFHYTYIAPAGQIGTKLHRVEIQSIANPELVGGAMILVTDADPESLNNAGQ